MKRPTLKFEDINTYVVEMRKYAVHLEKVNVELLEALNDAIIDVEMRCEELGLDKSKYSTWIKANEAIKKATSTS